MALKKTNFPHPILDEIMDTGSIRLTITLSWISQLRKKRKKNHNQPLPLLDENHFPKVVVGIEADSPYIALSTSLNLKCKIRMLYFPMDFWELSTDDLVDTGAISSALPQADLRKYRLLAPQTVIREGPLIDNSKLRRKLLN